MNMADAAEQVLRSSGRDLSSREIAVQALADGLIAPRSDQPWVYVTAAIRKDNARRQKEGKAARFAPAGTGRYKLNGLPVPQRRLPFMTAASPPPRVLLPLVMPGTQ